MANSSPATVNQGQETDSNCEDKQREAALFLLQLKEKTKLQQSVIDNVVEGVTVLFKKSIRRLKRKVAELLDSEYWVILLHQIAFRTFGEMKQHHLKVKKRITSKSSTWTVHSPVW